MPQDLPSKSQDDDVKQIEQMYEIMELQREMKDLHKLADESTSDDVVHTVATNTTQ